ncbi:Fc.00g037580.m01.CDS01 [Cosmosporella sp. VM-42]
MFYSHDILCNSQYGVATIWLVATIGKATNKKVTRKAIQDVNVPKACETIIDPGAPLALRLQGNLLYGVSRVFAQQCGYVLSDAEKTQSDMMTFFRAMKTSEIDPQAGKAKRHQITLQDDPSFDPLSILPNLDLFSMANDLVFFSTESSIQNVSQMTPLNSSQGSSSSGRRSLFGFDLPQSSRSGSGYCLPSDFGHDNSPFPKPLDEVDPMAESQQFGVDEFDPFANIGLDFDGDGNLIGLIEPEPELPPLPGSEANKAQRPSQDVNIAGVEQQQGLGQIGDDNVLIMGEDALPDAEPFPKRPAGKRPYSSSTPTTESFESERATAPAKRGRPRKACVMVDQQDHIGRVEFRNWSQNYLDNMEASRKRPRTTTQAQARKNALAFLLNNGIANVGNPKQFAGLVHPLAEDFAGSPLKARLDGKHPEEVEEAAQRGRRRSSSEAFKEDKDGQRRVKQKTNEASELARGLDDDLDALTLGDDTAPELGMDAAPAMEEHLSSSVMPWNRPSSVIQGSSIRGHGSAQKGIPAPSPLLGHGSVLHSIERHSDFPGPAQGSDGFAQLYSQDSSIDFGGPVQALDFTRGEDAQTSGAGLDVASQEFLGYATAQAQAKGHARTTNGQNRRWIEFEELANPATHTRSVAAQAFMHVLSLATKNAISIEQEGENQEPFGVIRIGLIITGRDDMEDELV